MDQHTCEEGLGPYFGRRNKAIEFRNVLHDPRYFRIRAGVFNFLFN
jgi:hypothetical protein